MDYESLPPKYKKFYKLLEDSQDLNFQGNELNSEILRIKTTFLWWLSKRELDILKNKVDNLLDIYKTWVNDLWEFYWVEITEYMNTSFENQNEKSQPRTVGLDVPSPQKQDEKPQPYHLDLLMNTSNYAEVQMNRLTSNIKHEYSKYENYKNFGIAIISGIISLIGLIISLGVTIPAVTFGEWVPLWITLIVLIGIIVFTKGIEKMNLEKAQKWILRAYSFLFLGLCIWAPWVYVDLQGHSIKRIGNYLIISVPKSIPHLIQTIDMNRLFLEIVGITIPAIILVLTFKKNNENN
jgi:hypothetical protein